MEEVDEGNIVPVGAAIDAAALVSETDAVQSHASSDEEAGWLSRRYQRRRLCGGTAASTSNETDASTMNEASTNNDTDRDEDRDSDDEAALNDPAGPGDLYCDAMDDDDEAWVYRHMRGGGDAAPPARRPPRPHATHERQGPEARATGEPTASTGDTAEERAASGLPTPQLRQALLLKPRTSDAVLSCPRCLSIVCMDCQEHDRYANQYRAMFVMNIGVDWNKKMRYDAAGGLRLQPEPVAGVSISRGGEEHMAQRQPDTIPHDTAGNAKKQGEELYYSVHCSYCQWELAALDMEDEIYYFFGCIASA